MPPKRSDRLTSSLMHVFRVTHEARDAKFVGPRVREDGKLSIVRAELRRTTLSEQALIDTVRSDLIALLNTVRFESAQSLEDAPNVQRSVLNYGFPDLMSRTLESNRNVEIGGEIERVLARHEPRLVHNSIKVEREKSEDKALMPKLRFFVRAALHATPVDLPLEFVAEVDETAGRLRVKPR